MNRPNVVLVCVDQWRGDALSAAGHPVVRTPYLDQLADGGTRFSRAYSATPTCVPARVALMTGQSQERHGRVGYCDGVPFDERHPVTLPRELRKAGYQTQAIGKMHVYPERSRIGFDDVRLHDGYLHTHADGTAATCVRSTTISRGCAPRRGRRPRRTTPTTVSTATV